METLQARAAEMMARPVRGRGINYPHRLEYPECFEMPPDEMAVETERAKVWSPHTVDSNGNVSTALDNDHIVVNKWQNSFSSAMSRETMSRPPQKGFLGQDLYSWHLSRSFNDQRPVFAEFTHAHMAIQLAMKEAKAGGNVAPDSALVAHRLRRETFNEIANTAREKRTVIFGADQLGDLIWQQNNPRKFEQFGESILRNSDDATQARKGTAGANIRSFSDESYLDYVNDHLPWTDQSVFDYVKAYSKVDGRPISTGLFRSAYPDKTKLLINNGVPVNSALAFYNRVAEVQIGRKLRSQFPEPGQQRPDRVRSDELLTAIYDPHMPDMEPLLHYFSQRAERRQRG